MKEIDAIKKEYQFIQGEIFEHQKAIVWARIRADELADLYDAVKQGGELTELQKEDLTALVEFWTE